MTSDEPLAFFLTWTIYGSHLQGDELGWRRRRGGNQLPQPRLAEWHRERLKHDVIFLSTEQRDVVKRQCERHCAIRGWRPWAISARSNHVHAVITAPGASGGTVRDKLKANATRALREQWPVFRERPLWSVGGDWVCVNSDADLESLCRYVLEAQDRMGIEETGG